MVLGVVAGTRQPEKLQMRPFSHVVMQDGKLVYLPPTQLFPEPQDWSEREVEVKVKLPDARLVASLRVTDAEGRDQATHWTEGQSDRFNPNYDPATGLLTLKLRPTRPEVDQHGHTDPGFDPTRIRALQVRLSPNGQEGLDAGRLDITSQLLKRAGSPPPAAQIRPLLKQPGPLLQPAELKSGVSRYFVYADLHHWEQARPVVEKAFSEQQQAGLRAFRNMGGIDVRDQKVGERERAAMREYLQLAEKYGQDQHIFTLLDGAIPNATLQKAFEDPGEARQLVKQLRPFISEFGQARINGQPVIFDLVNEIHGTAGPDAGKQYLVEQLIDTFVEVAPGARLTVGVQNFRQLDRWHYLFEKYQGKPVEFVVTYHVYEPIENIPHRSELNVPDNVEVGITEADPNKGVGEIVRQVRGKGYDWLLFWQDAAHPYQPRQHKDALTHPGG